MARVQRASFSFRQDLFATIAKPCRQTHVVSAEHVYVWKSFGDTHTSIPVYVEESERAGRFVGRMQTECGIHTRIAEKGKLLTGFALGCIGAVFLKDPKVATPCLFRGVKLRGSSTLSDLCMQCALLSCGYT